MNKVGIRILACLLLLEISIGIVAAQVSLPRVIVTTDGEVDDKSSFIRYLMYCNHFKTEGLIYTNSKWQNHGHGVTWMQEYIELWNKYRENILKHQTGYPTANELKNVIVAGNMDVNYLNYTGALETEGAKHIVNVLLNENPDPVWIQVWGGTNTIAQALSILRRDYPQTEINRALSKLRIYAIDDQDNTGTWIRKEFPQVFFIRSGQFTALNYQHEGHPYTNDAIFSEKWMNENVKQEHGDFGASYPQSYFSEGDSPAFFYLISNGLYAPEQPTFGCWGGRFIKQENNFYTDAIDGGDRLHGQWIWLKDIQNDFAARMDWCVKSYQEANHYPVIPEELSEKISAKAGETIKLSAKGCTDPDHNKLVYEWRHYQYAGNNPYSHKLLIKGKDLPCISLQIPWDTSGKEIHLILSVRDNGTPSLVSYKRIIITVAN